jgi:hypothetical protein
VIKIEIKNHITQSREPFAKWRKSINKLLGILGWFTLESSSWIIHDLHPPSTQCGGTWTSQA